MGRYIIRRLLWVILLLLIVSAVTFVIFYALPSGDPAALRAGRSPTPDQLAEIRHTLGLDKPIYEQYWLFIKAIVLHFDFGYSYTNSQPVRHGDARATAGHPLAHARRRGAVAAGRPAGRRLSAIKSRSFLDRATMGARPPRHLRAGLLARADGPVLLLQGHRARRPHLRRRGVLHAVQPGPRRSGSARCCCPGSCWPRRSPPSTPGFCDPTSSIRCRRTTFAPPGPRASRSGS